MFSRIFDNKTAELDAQFDVMLEKMKAEQDEHERRLRTRMGMLTGMLTNSSGLFGGQAIASAAGQANMMNSIGATAQAGILREEPRDHAVRVEYVPVENGYVVNIAKGYNQTAKVYVAKDLAEAHELVTTFMVKERLK